MPGVPSLLVNIDVPDLARGIDFYTRAFGLRLGRRFGADGVELLGAAAPLYLLVKAPGTPAHAGGAARDYRRHWTPVHLDFVVEALEPAREAVLAAGARAESEILVASWGRMVLLSDPFGHGLCLLEFTPPLYYAHATPAAGGG
jgi:catechol 2,3-dioxygenase-like lactoylglutathione lyase family enzyme